MKFSFNFFAGLALSTSLLLTATSCEKMAGLDPMPISNTPTGTTPPAPNGPGDIKIIQFDPMTMKAKMDAFLNSRNLSGYAYSIFVNGKRVVSAEGQGGLARKAVDAPQRIHTPLTRQEVASCSKFITALAMVRMLDRANLSINTNIGPYLPAFMNAHANVRQLTFRQLLSQHSGLVGGNQDVNLTLAKMTTCVQTDNAAGLNNYQYNNMNFALCRLLLPYVYWKWVLGLSPQTMSVKEANPTALDIELGNVFLFWVRNDVFKPAGLADWNQLGAADPAPGLPLLLYGNNLPGSASANISPLNLGITTNLGSVGFDLSAVELAQITSAAHDYKILSEASLKILRTGFSGRPLGFNDSATGKYGEYYFKDGDLSWGGVGMATVLVDFDCPSANVQVAVVSNQNDGAISTLGWLQNAFDTSWK